MNAKELAGAMRKGIPEVVNSRYLYLMEDEKVGPCGCALGTAWIGAGMTVKSFEELTWNLPALQALAYGLGISFDLAKRVDKRHQKLGFTREQVAEWLEGGAQDETS